MHISHIDIGLRQFSFSWSPVAPDCPGIRYNILASNCGSCPTTTNHTTVTCTDVPTDGQICTFATQNIICGKIKGNTNHALAFNVTDTLNSEEKYEQTAKTCNGQIPGMLFLYYNDIIVLELMIARTQLTQDTFGL